jgi:hypothetical protein
MTPMRKPVSTRFWSFVDKNGPCSSFKPELGPCWLWTGFIGKKGYGRFGITNRLPVQAHRWAYESVYGTIDANLDIDHLCRVRHCVNPNHLEAVTRRENVVNRGFGITAANALKTHCKNGHPFVDGNVFKKANGERRCKICQNAMRGGWGNGARARGQKERRLNDCN